MNKRISALMIAALVGLHTNIVQASEELVPVTSQKVGTAGGHTPKQRSPMRLPIIYIDGRTLLFEESLIGYEVKIFQDGQEMLSLTVGDDCTIVLPDSLTGECELKIVMGDYIITGIFLVE